MSKLPFHLGLRNRQHMVSLIRNEQGGRTRDVLGMAYPQDMNPRLHILEQWGMNQASPRLNMQATIDQPLPRRHQVALQAQLNPAIQHSLNSGFDPQPTGRRETVPGVKARLHLGVTRTPLTNGLPPLSPTRGANLSKAETEQPPRGGKAVASGGGRKR